MSDNDFLSGSTLQSHTEKQVCLSSKHYSIWKSLHQQSQKNQATAYSLQKSLNSLKRILLPLPLLPHFNVLPLTSQPQSYHCILLANVQFTYTALSNNRARVCFGFEEAGNTVTIQFFRFLKPSVNRLHGALSVLLVHVFCSMESRKVGEPVCRSFTLETNERLKDLNSTPQPRHGLLLR